MSFPVFALNLLVLLAPQPVVQPAVQPAAKQPTLAMAVKGGVLGTVTIQAKQVEARQIVERLSRDLKIPIEATKVVLDHKVDLSLVASPVLSLLTALAPIVFADLEISQGEEPVWKAVHLLGFNEGEPPRALKQTGFLIFAGVAPDPSGSNQQDSQEKKDDAAKEAFDAEAKDDEPFLRVMVAADGRVSVRSRQQPLIAILNEVAAKTIIPIDLRGETSMDLIDVEFRDIPLRDIGAAIGRPGYRLVVRRNLATNEEVVQGILVGMEPKPAQ